MELARIVNDMHLKQRGRNGDGEPTGVLRMVQKCPRCKKTHAINARELVYPTNEAGHSHWAMCPVLNEPLFVGFMDLGELDEAMRVL